MAFQLAAKNIRAKTPKNIWANQTRSSSTLADRPDLFYYEKPHNMELQEAMAEISVWNKIISSSDLFVFKDTRWADDGELPSILSKYSPNKFYIISGRIDVMNMQRVKKYNNRLFTNSTKIVQTLPGVYHLAEKQAQDPRRLCFNYYPGPKTFDTSKYHAFMHQYFTRKQDHKEIHDDESIFVAIEELKAKIKKGAYDSVSIYYYPSKYNIKFENLTYDLDKMKLNLYPIDPNFGITSVDSPKF